MIAPALLALPTDRNQASQSAIAERERITDRIVDLLFAAPAPSDYRHSYTGPTGDTVALTNPGHEQDIEALWRECDALLVAGEGVNRG